MHTRVHISIEVSDIQKSVDFYSRVFQMQPTKLQGDYANFRMEAPQLHLALVHNPARSPEPHSNRHYGIELFNDEHLIEWRDAVEQTGIDLRIEEQTTCCYAIADKFWVKDPDGHEWEFWVRHAEAATMHGEDVVAYDEKDFACCAPQEEPILPKKDACCTPGAC